MTDRQTDKKKQCKKDTWKIIEIQRDKKSKSRRFFEIERQRQNKTERQIYKKTDVKSQTKKIIDIEEEDNRYRRRR